MNPNILYLINKILEFYGILASDETLFWVMIYLIIDTTIITPLIIYYAFVKRDKKKKEEKRII